jgi:DNA repair ATPase RecN
VIRKDKDKYVSNPDPLYRNTNAAAFLPLTPCLDCDRIKNTISSDMNRNVSSNSQSESVSKASAANEASKGNACVAISTIMKELDDAQDIVDQMIAADNIKKTKDKIQKLVPLERKYTEKNRNISSLSKSLESNPQAKNCPGLQEMEARKSKVSADYAKRTASSGTKGLGGKLLSQTLGGL